MKLRPPQRPVAARYLRYSTSLQDERSLEGQDRRCLSFIAKKEFATGPAFSDAERSGTTTVGRTGLFDMLAAAGRGEFQALVVEDLDRISRDIVDAHVLFRRLQELDIPIWSVSTGSILTEEEVAFKSLIASREVHRARDRTRRGLELVVAKGRHVGSVSYGYRKVLKFDERGEPINGLREIENSVAAIVRRIFREYINGTSPYAICVALNTEGIPSPGGGKWTSGALTGSPAYADGILRNTNYIGLFRFGRTVVKRKAGKVYQVPTDESDRTVTDHPDLAIVDQKTFEAAQALLAQRSHGGFHTHKKAIYLFTGKLACGQCGESYIVHKGKLDCTGNFQKGICSNSRRVDRPNLESAVLEELEAHLLAPDLLHLCLAEYRRAAAEALQEHAFKSERSSGRLQDLNVQVVELKETISLASRNPRARLELLDDLDKLLEEQEGLQLEADTKPPPVAPQVDTDAVVAALKNAIQNLAENLNSQSPEAIQVRDQLRECVDQIVINPTPDTSLDGRGAGPVSITVEGRLAEFLDLASIDVDRISERPSGTTSLFGDTVLGFTFTFPLRPDDTLQRQLYSDLPIIARLLDQAAVPVTLRTAAAALGGDDAASVEAVRHARWRAREAFNHLRALSMARRIAGGPQWKGWVWEQAGLTDEEWIERARSPSSDQLKAPKFATPPEAKVVIIGSRAEPGKSN